MAQRHKIGTHATTIQYAHSERRLRVTYHSTDVVTLQGDRLTLATGGYYTKTTKLRMNQASNQFGLKYWVFQKNFDWWCEYKGIVYPFINGVCNLILED